MPDPNDPFESFRRARAAVPAGVLESLEKANRLRSMVESVQRAKDLFPAGFEAVDQARDRAPAFMTCARAADALPAAFKAMGPGRELPMALKAIGAGPELPMALKVIGAEPELPMALKVIGPGRELPPAFTTVARAHDTLPAALKVIDQARDRAPAIMTSARAADALPAALKAMGPMRELPAVLKVIGQARDLPPGCNMFARAQEALPAGFHAAVGPVGLTTVDAQRLHSLTSRYAMAVPYPTALPSLSIREQAEHLEPPTSSLMVAVAAKPDPAEVFERAGEDDDDIVTLLSTLVAWIQQEQRKSRGRTYLVVTTYVTLYTALTGTLQIFGYERIVRALQALEHALQQVH